MNGSKSPLRRGLLLAGALLMALGAMRASALTPSAMSMDLYGYLDQLVVGDVVTVQDPDGVECGYYQVTSAGRYGFLHVYGDDPATTQDEGARPGDVLSFFLNGVAIVPAGGSVLWEGDLVSMQVDLAPPAGVAVASASDSSGGGGVSPIALLSGLMLLMLAGLRRRG